MFENTSKRDLAVPAVIMAAALMICCVFAVFSYESDAATGDSAADPYIVQIAPGYEWTYTPTFPAELEGVTINVIDDFPENAVVFDENTHVITLTVPGNAIPEGETSKNYNMEIVATHAASEQTKSQFIQFQVLQGIAIVPAGENLANAVVGTEKTYSFTATTTYSTIDSITASINGLTVNQDYTVSVDGNTVSVTLTPTEAMVGEQTITVTATAAAGEDKTVTNTFKVYRDLVLTASNSVIGNCSNASTVISVPEGLVPTFEVDTSSNAAITWTSETRTLSVSSTEYIDEVITIKATSEDGQTADPITIDVHNEAASLAINPSVAQVITYNDNTTDPKVTVTLSGTNSGINETGYTLATAITGVDVNPATGEVTIDSSAVDLTKGTTVTINATTVFGKAITGSFNLIVEGDLSFPAPADNTLIIITTGTSSIESEALKAATTNGDVVTYEVTGMPNGCTASVGDDGKLTVSHGTPGQVYNLTVTASTAGGQSLTQEFQISTFVPLTFEREPTNAINGVGV